MVTIFRCKCGGTLTILYFKDRMNAIDHFCKVAKSYGHDVKPQTRTKIENKYPYETITLYDNTDSGTHYHLELESRNFYEDVTERNY